VIEKLIKQELAEPKKFKPIANGWFVSVLLASFCLLTVPFYLLLKFLKR
jgi:hypothetical protein